VTAFQRQLARRLRAILVAQISHVELLQKQLKAKHACNFGAKHACDFGAKHACNFGAQLITAMLA
jgi:hypothetical protein